MTYALNLAADGRVQSVCMALPSTPQEMPRVDILPDGDCAEYLFKSGVYVHAPLLPQPTPEPQPSADDRRDAQLTYTAMMTDTLLPVGALNSAESEEETNV